MEDDTYFVDKYLRELPKDDSLKVMRLNHFFKWKGVVYFEVMIGLSPT